MRMHKLSTSSKSGFTLAEVLITLGIIGVVAAMTMPSLITAKQEKATISTIKKNYSIFSYFAIYCFNSIYF